MSLYTDSTLLDFSNQDMFVDFGGDPPEPSPNDPPPMEVPPPGQPPSPTPAPQSWAYFS